MSNATAKTASSLDEMSPRRRQLAEFWFYFSENKGAVIGLWFFLALIVVAVLAPLIAPHEPYQQYRDAVLVPPVWQANGRWEFLLGTDAVGRDILSRLLFGARYSLFIGIVVTTIALVAGIFVGVLAGYFRGWLDTVIMRLMDIILAFPSLLLALTLVAVLGPGLDNAMIAIALVYQPHFVRLTRAAVMTEKSRDYVVAARVAGAGPIRLMFRTILPNCMAPLIVQARLAETFQRSGSFAGVGKPGEGLAIDYQIIVEIRSFEVRVTGGERADVDLFVRILNDRNGEVRAARDFTASVPVSGGGNQAYIDALDRAFGETAREIVGWTDTVI